jgi:hypothetical protein
MALSKKPPSVIFSTLLSESGSAAKVGLLPYTSMHSWMDAWPGVTGNHCATVFCGDAVGYRIIGRVIWGENILV